MVCGGRSDERNEDEIMGTSVAYGFGRDAGWDGLSAKLECPAVPSNDQPREITHTLSREKKTFRQDRTIMATIFRTHATAFLVLHGDFRKQREK